MASIHQNTNRIPHLNSAYIRTFAALGVILIHSTGTYLWDFKPTAPFDARWWTGNLYCSLLRWATPFFILLSGSVFLDPERSETTAGFLGKRLRRVLFPFAFWTLIYLAYQYRGSFAGDEAPKLGVVLNKVFFEDVYYHLWFIPMITGLYFLTPTFRIFIRHARCSDIEYFLALCFVITTVQHWVPGFFIVEYIGWLGYIGFYVLGYYLGAFDIAGWKKKTLYATGLFMPAVTALGTWYLSMQAGKHDEKMLVYFSPNVVLMTAAFFVWMKERDWRGFSTRRPRLNSAVQAFAALSFGVYFLHVMVLDVLKNGYIAGIHITSESFLNIPVHPFPGALLQMSVVAAVSAAIIFALSRVRGLDKWIM